MSSVHQEAGPRQTELLLDNIPEVLRRRPQWVAWKLEQRSGKRTKVPYIAGGVGKADTTDLMTWRTFEQAVTALETGRYNGIGFVFCSGDHYAGIDLDDCRDPETGEVEAWATEIVASFGEGVYREVSQSGTGVHIIVKGKAPNKKVGQVEAYSIERFFAMTGVAL